MNKTYICPMHPEIKQDKPGRCPKCGMRLVDEKSVSKAPMVHTEDNISGSYTPLYVVLILIVLVALTASYPSFNLRDVLMNFMAGFFIVFSGFKLMDLKGFAEGYSTYDLLAKRWYAYGYIYPFIELFFGLSMIVGLFEMQILWAELIVMTFSGIGVAIKLAKRERFQCVCLGTFLKVPLTRVTLIENFGMAALAAILLFLL